MNLEKKKESLKTVDVFSVSPPWCNQKYYERYTRWERGQRLKLYDESL